MRFSLVFSSFISLSHTDVFSFRLRPYRCAQSATGATTWRESIGHLLLLLPVLLRCPSVMFCYITQLFPTWEDRMKRRARRGVERNRETSLPRLNFVEVFARNERGRDRSKAWGLDRHNPIVTLKKKRREPSAAAAPETLSGDILSCASFVGDHTAAEVRGGEETIGEGGERSILIHSTITNTASSMFSWLGSGLSPPPPFATSCDSYEAGVSPSP